MRAYSTDLRTKILAAVDGGMSKSEAARVFRVGISTITRYAQQRRQTGSLAPRPLPGRPPTFSRDDDGALVAAFSVEGISAAMTVEGALDTLACAAYVAHILAPTLHPGQRAVLDTRAVHHTAAIRQVRAAHGCRVLSLPSYAPDLTPIAQAFATIKTARRRLGARTREAVEAAIAQAIDHITPRDARGFFRHCHYHSPAQLF